MPDMELESLRRRVGVRIFGRGGVREKGGSDEPPEPPLVTGLHWIIRFAKVNVNKINMCYSNASCSFPQP